MSMITIRSFEPKDAAIFKQLNIEWLETYFEVEPIDEFVLSNPIEQIIEPGGFIFMAELNNEVVGTFAFKKDAEGFMELTKMAVLPAIRGGGVGKALLAFAIEFADQQQWPFIYLYSNTKLAPAIHLYRKVGFIEQVLDASLYKRANIKMRYFLHEK
jgi:ribosomal protein S18 acetylase RimI-like enzyme